MKEAPMRVGIIGFGAIGQAIVTLLDERAAGSIQIVAALVRDPQKERTGSVPPLVHSLDALLAERPDVVVEAGGHRALRDYGPSTLRSGSDLIMISIGALADPEVERAITQAARIGQSQARVISGAIGGLDALAAAAMGGLTYVLHTTSKPARTLMSKEEYPMLRTATEIFRGTAREGALKFPESVNVAAAVSLAGVGFDRTQVRVVADPELERNRHEVRAEGTFGTMHFEIQNVPSEGNPRSAKLVAMSAAHVLMQRRSNFIVG